MRKLGVVVGHTKKNQGAFSKTLGVAEYAWNKDLAARIEGFAAGMTDLTVQTFFRDGVGIKGAYQATDAFGADITVELHFNGSDNHRATGSAVLYYPRSTNGRRFATLLQKEISAVLGLKNWPRGSDGVLTPFEASGKEKRGQGSLSAGRAPATLFEPFFGSNPNDANTADKNKDRLAQAILDAALSY